MIWNKIAFPVKEVWKEVEDYEGMYQVSNYGRVKSLKRTITWVCRNGKAGKKYVPERTLSLKTDKDGYKEVALSKGGKAKHIRVHRLVAYSFLEETHTPEVIDHIDNTKDNNMWYNLQWLSSEANTIKYYSEDFGKDKTLSSLSKYEWKYIGFLYNKGLSYEAICTNLGLTVESYGTIWEGLCGRRLSSISGFKEGDFKTRPHPTTKLTEDQVVQIIKERLIGKIKLKDLSTKWGIAESMISRFCKGTRQPTALIKFKEKYKEYR